MSYRSAVSTPQIIEFHSGLKAVLRCEETKITRRKRTSVLPLFYSITVLARLRAGTSLYAYKRPSGLLILVLGGDVLYGWLRMLRKLLAVKETQ